MRRAASIILLAAVATAPISLPAPALAQRNEHRWEGDRNQGWDPAHHYSSRGHHRERRLGRNDRIYRGSDGRYYCRRSDGTTGLVIGAVGGAILGGAVGGDALGALLGAAGGGLLGRSIDRGKIRCR